MAFLRLAPWIFGSFSGEVPGRVRNRGGRAQLFPARRGSGDGGPTGEKREGHKSYLWRGLGLQMVACGGLAAERGGRQRTGPAAAAFRRGKDGVTGCRRFRAAMGS